GQTTVGGAVTVTNGTVPGSAGATFNSTGTFYWQAAYSGDTNNNSATSTCGSEVLTVNPNTFTLTVTGAGAGSGTINASPSLTSCSISNGTTCSGSFTNRSSVTLNAT